MFKAITVAVLMLVAAGTALAQNPRNALIQAQRAGLTRPGRTVSKVRQPVGTPHKSSALAPRPSNKRVFGAPIQAPIVHSAPPPK